MATVALDRTISANYNVSTIPYTVVFARIGVVDAEFEGLYSAEEYEAAVK